MQLIFIDESGYAPNWEESIDEQPFYVLGAVVIPFDNYVTGCQKIRKEIEKLNLPNADRPLGLGFEIKARNVATGTGWWRRHQDIRDKVKNIMLSFPKENNGVAIVVVIDKKAHQERYFTPENPYHLALRFLLERLQHLLTELNDYGVAIFDLNQGQLKAISELESILRSEGSDILKWTWPFGLPFTFTLKVDRIVEFTYGVSHNSIGLNIADFFATMTYHYHKNGRSHAESWSLIEQSLYRCSDSNTVVGYGYKLFPCKGC